MALFGEFLWLAAIAAFFVGLSKGGLPATAMVSVPLLSLVIDPLTAAALLLPIYLVSDAYGIWLYRAEYSARNLAILIPGGLAGIVAGYLLAPRVPVAGLELLVGVIGVSFCLRAWFGSIGTAAPRPARVAPGVFWGTLAGFTSFITHAGAPPFQTYVLPQRLPRMVFAGTSTIFFAIINFAKIPPYLALGQFPSFPLGPTALLAAVAIAGAYCGRHVIKLMPEAMFYRLVQGVLFVVSVRLMWEGVVGLSA